MLHVMFTPKTTTCEIKSGEVVERFILFALRHKRAAENVISFCYVFMGRRGNISTRLRPNYETRQCILW